MVNSIGREGYKISFISTTPGKIVQVANDFSEAIVKYSGADPVCFLQLFGKYDLCAIYRTKDYLSGPSKAGSIDNIRGGNQILAFPWLSQKDKQPFANKGSSKKIWGLLFFRTNELLANKYGTIIEQFLADYWADKNTDTVEFDILGTTGWAELVFIVRGNKFSDVLSTLSQISQQSISIENNENTFSAKTFSLIGMDYDLIKQGNYKILESIFDEKIEDGKDIFPRLNITCAPGDMHEVYKLASEKIGTGYYSYGSFDLSFKPAKCETWGKLAKNVLELRKDMKGKLYSTDIRLFGKKEMKEYPNFPSHAEARAGIQVDSERIKLFRKWGPIFENTLLNLYFGVSNLMQDPLIGDCFADLKPSLDKSLPEWLGENNVEDKNLHNFMGEYIERITFGAMERGHGAFSALEYPNSHFSSTKGGIQRILKAISIVPKKVLARIDVKWNGFIVTGFRDLSFSAHHDIINLPSDFLFKPEDWWGLFHEIGHTAMYEEDFIDLLGHEKIIYIIDEISSDKNNSFSRGYIENFISEIGADCFDLYFCHRSDIDLYLKNIWPYIHERGFKADHYSRYFCMFLYWKYILLEKKNVFPEQINVHNELDEFRKKLVNLKLQNINHVRLNVTAESSFNNYSNIINILHSAFSKQLKVNDLSIELNNRNLKKAISTVLEGQIYTSTIEDPDLFILALKKEKSPINFSIRMAAIISLWHTAMIEDS